LIRKLDQFNPTPKHIEINYGLYNNLKLKEKVFAAKKSYEFDVEFTRKIFGAPTIDYHFMSVGSVNYLDSIAIPVLYL
jgi:predicted alpha/beta-fold hydrolase